MPSNSRYITDSIIGDYVTILQGDIHNHAPRESDSCLADLRITDPRDDKTRIEETKGNLLRDSYCWILEHADFKMWCNDPQCRLLWIKGDPGKGKTMLLCGIIDELEKLKMYRLSYFFCQATEARLRSATAVLRGLIYCLIVQQPSLISHVRDKYNHAGKQLFEDNNAWTALSKILKAILDDPDLQDAVLIIDALDECTEELPRLLILVQGISSTSSAKFIVSSRNWPRIENELENNQQIIRLCLELNEDSISSAVRTYINHKVDYLAQKNKYNNKIREETQSYLISNANNTFLWVALVCQSLESLRSGKVIKRLTTYPPGLDSLYERMLGQILELDDDDDVSLCRHVLTIVSIVYRPVTLYEVHSLIGSPEEFLEDIASFTEIIRLCGSFLTIRGNTIYFIHQSAKDYLTTDKAWSTISPSSAKDIHYTIFSRSLQCMDATLQRDIYCLRAPGYPISQLQQPNPDPLIAVRYSCFYWIDHLCDYNIGDHMKGALQEGGLVDVFIRHHFLHWLEVLSLLQGMSEGILAIAGLTDLLAEQAPKGQVLSLVQDARRFIFRNKSVIESTPLQVYVSALIFSPLQSRIRKIFKDKEPSWMLLKPAVEADWDACLQTLVGHRGPVTSVVFSTDGQRLASASDDRTVKVWDANSGACLQTIECQVKSVVFSPDGQRLASNSRNKTFRVWNVSSGACLQTLEGHNDSVESVVFSPDGQRLASGSRDKTVIVWDANSGARQQTLEGHCGWVQYVAFSPNSSLIASASDDSTVRLWRVSSGECIWTLQGHSDFVRSMAFSHDLSLVALALDNNTVQLWGINTGKWVQTLEGHSNSIYSVAFSYDASLVASASSDKKVRLWRTDSGKCVQTLEGHSDLVQSLAFSPNSSLIASASDDKTVRLWDVNTSKCMQTLDGHSNSIYSVAFSYDASLVASALSNKTVQLWRTDSGKCVQTLEGHSHSIQSVVFSHDSSIIASASYDKTVRLWRADTGECVQILEGHSDWVQYVAFSHDSSLIASASDDATVRLWRTNSGECVQILKGHSNSVYSMAFSYNSALIVSASSDKTARLWHTHSGECVRTLKGHNDSVESVVFSPNGQRLASGSRDKTVIVWDANSGACQQTLKGHSDLVQSVAFSHDSSLVASASGDETVRLWRANTGDCVQILNTGYVSHLSFNPTHLQLITDIGVFTATGTNYVFHATSYGLSRDRCWITWNGNNLLWLPMEYRPSHSAASDLTVAVGCHSGRVLVMAFSNYNE